MNKLTKNQEGYVVSLMTFFTLIVVLSIAVSTTALTVFRQKVSTNAIRATQSYYGAEGGIEDALLRVRNNPQMGTLSYSMNVGPVTANVTIPNIFGTSRAVVSKSDNGGIKKTIEAVYNLDTQGSSFNYAAQVGDGGIQGCNNNCRIKGNVFSNGDIEGKGLTIDNNAVVARNGNEIEDIYVKGSVKVHSCKKAKIDGNLTYVTGGSVTNCTVGGSTYQQSQEIPPEPMPISQGQIDSWKNDAAAGTIFNNSLTLSNGEVRYFGPAKIVGNLTLNNNSSLILTGIVYVTGNIVLQNNATIKLDSSYGSLSGIILLDGNIDIKNNAVLDGSGQTGSYIMVLSTSNSGSAITVNQNVQSAVLYTSNGGITLNQNVQVHQITAYKIIINNNVTMEYEVGLTNSFFVSGPGGSGVVISWQEQ